MDFWEYVKCEAKGCPSGQGGLRQTLWGPSSSDQVLFLQETAP